MLNVETQIKHAVNEILMSTDLNVTAVDKVIRDGVAKVMAESFKFERSPFIKPNDMSLAEYDATVLIYKDLRNKYFDSRGDIFAFVEVTRSINFNASDSKAIFNEKFHNLIMVVEDDLADWKTAICKLFGRRTGMVHRYDKVLQAGVEIDG